MTSTINAAARYLLRRAADASDALTPTGRRTAWRRRARRLQDVAEQRYAAFEPIELAIAGTDVRVATVQLGHRTVVTGQLAAPRPARGRHAAHYGPVSRLARYHRAPVALAGWAASNGLRRPSDPDEARGWLRGALAVGATVPALAVLLAVAVLSVVVS